MGLIKIIVFLVVLGYGARYVRDHYVENASETTSARGFVPVPAAEGLTGDAVTIVTTTSASDVAVARGNALAAGLTEKGIPVLRAERVSFNASGDSVAAARAVLVMSGEQPVVLVRGRAKPNPTLTEVVLEFRAQ